MLISLSKKRHGNGNAEFLEEETSTDHKRLRVLHVGHTVAYTRGLYGYDVT